MEADGKAKTDAEAAARRATGTQGPEKTLRAKSPPGTAAKPGECPCGSHRRSALRSRRAMGLCGFDVRIVASAGVG